MGTRMEADAIESGNNIWENMVLKLASMMVTSIEDG
jgi:hypothetical protein